MLMAWLIMARSLADADHAEGFAAVEGGGGLEKSIDATSESM